ncbi:hypothetical protein HPP92_001556 [Vanilla planifolia]|uniref:Uncharacterized protein n=1 Tax=Vanilla planifolia TaxID=51239 RepID=A0A835RQV8_VANPL|nr:hypothetical protein HPP92_001556 [Vanilla planifolia]
MIGVAAVAELLDREAGWVRIAESGVEGATMVLQGRSAESRFKCMHPRNSSSRQPDTYYRAAAIQEVIQLDQLYYGDEIEMALHWM